MPEMEATAGTAKALAYITAELCHRFDFDVGSASVIPGTLLLHVAARVALNAASELAQPLLTCTISDDDTQANYRGPPESRLLRGLGESM
jgi:hypothetical protein